MHKPSYLAALLLTLALLGANAAQATTSAAAALVTQGEQQWKAGQLADAQKSFQAALVEQPRSVDIQLKLAGLQLSNNDFAACIPAYQTIIGLDAGNVRAWLGLGFAYLHTGKNSLSMAAFQEAIRLDPSKKATLQPMLAKLQTP
jgi:cytochrome c-type biogenesis protein CcmH/NrfG